MVRTWGWVGQYVIAILLALLLGAILGHLRLFEETVLGDTKLSASRVVQFMGYGGALLLLWLLGRRAAMQLPEDGRGLSFLRHIMTPLTTLIVVSSGYKVLLLLGSPFLDKTGKTIYNWVFVIGIVSAALWLTLTWFMKSAPLIETLEAPGRVGQSDDPQSSFPCQNCRRLIANGMKFCGYCGTSVG